MVGVTIPLIAGFALGMPRGIRINAVAPGLVETTSVAAMVGGEEAAQRLFERAGLGSLMIEAYATGFPIRVSTYGMPSSAPGDQPVVGFTRPWATAGTSPTPG